MWNKIKGFVFSFLIGVVFVAFIVLFRSNPDRRRVSDSDELDREIKTGIDGIQDGITDVAGSIDGVSSDIGQGAAQAGDIANRISGTEAKLQSALDILRRAKEKTKPDLAG